MRKFAFALAVMILLAGIVPFALAQETTAGLQGTVKDSSGAAVAGATVEVLGSALLGARRVQTDSAGEFHIVALPPGSYTLSVTSTGFRTYRQSGIVLDVGRLPILATLGDISEPALIEILTRPKNALAKQYQRMFEMEGVKLRFQEEALHSIARKAIARRTGARGLRSIMEGFLLETMFELPTLNGVQEVVVTSDVVEGKARPLYTYSDKAEARENKAS